MNPRDFVVAAASWFLLAVIQLLCGLSLPVAAVVGGAGVGILGFGIHRLFHVHFEGRWTPVPIAATASAAGIAAVYFGIPQKSEWTLWLAPLAAAVASGMVVLARSAGGKRCALCNRRLGSRDVAFECPRCALLVCEQTCWVFDHCRCRLCEDNRVPIFPADGRWWDKRFGPRVNYGRCQLCLAEAAEGDLRACGRCGRAQCRPCWDAANGQCSRCGWIVEGLPERLQVFMAGR